MSTKTLKLLAHSKAFLSLVTSVGECLGIPAFVMGILKVVFALLGTLTPKP